MRRWIRPKASWQNRKGGILPLVAVFIPVLLIFAAFSISIAHVQLTRTELRTATDAASRAGARKLSLSQNVEQARTAAIDAARKNTVAGTSLLLRPTDLDFGLAQPPSGGGRWAFVPATGSDPMNSIRVTGSRTEGSLSGPIPMMFPGIAKSFEPTKTSTATQIDRDIALVLDRSGSMTEFVDSSKGPPPWSNGEAAPKGSKWRALSKAVTAFLKALERTPQDEQVALITYSTTATHELDLSLNYKQILKQMKAHTDSFNGGRTAVGDGADLGTIAVTNPGFARRFAQKTIVVLTDGIHNEGKMPDSVALDAFKNSGVTVHTITFGGGANQTLMKKTAGNGNGRHWHAATDSSLVDAFEEIANNLPTLLTE